MANSKPMVEVYPMGSHIRGRCIIINNYEFDRGTNLKTLNENIADIDALRQTWTKLRFKIEYHRNLTGKKMLDTIRKAGKDPAQADCFVCFILSHGNEGFVCGRDDVDVKIAEFTNLVKPSNCRNLKGKPKIFFIDACRGGKKLTGSSSSGSRPVSGPPSSKSRKLKVNVSEVNEESDFVVASSTVQGYLSYSNHFIKIVSDCFNEYAESEDLLSILTMVKNRATTGGGGKDKQMPSVSETLRKKVYFTTQGNSVPKGSRLCVTSPQEDEIRKVKQTMEQNAQQSNAMLKDIQAKQVKQEEREINLEKQHKKEMAALQEQIRKDMSASQANQKNLLKDELKKQVEKERNLREQQTKEMAALREQHTKEMTEYREQHTKEVAEYREQHTKEVAAHAQQMAASQADLRDMHTTVKGIQEMLEKERTKNLLKDKQEEKERNLREQQTKEMAEYREQHTKEMAEYREQYSKEVAAHAQQMAASQANFRDMHTTVKGIQEMMEKERTKKAIRKRQGWKHRLRRMFSRFTRNRGKRRR